MFNVRYMGIVALKYNLPSTEKIIKQERFKICLPSLCVYSWHFVNIGSFWSNIRCTFPPSDSNETVSQLSGHGEKAAWKGFQETAKFLDKLGKES